MLEELRLLCLVAALWGLVAVGFLTAVSCGGDECESNSPKRGRYMRGGTPYPP